LEWCSYPHFLKEQISFCIIDDCSKIPADKVLSDVDLSDLDIHIYRVTDDLYCNIAGVRNLSASVCETDWMVILDMDTMIPKELAFEMLKLSNSEKGNCFKFNRRIKNHEKNNQIHPAVCLLRKDDYWNVGGCDEDLVGNYGFTDPIFWYRAEGKLKIIEKKNLFLQYIPEGESKIIRNTERNEKIFRYKKAKNDWSKEYIRFDWVKVY
jgi:hypothetical protein